METNLEYNLKLQLEIVKEQRDIYKFQLETAEQCIADYKKVTQNQQITICELKDEIMATEVARYEYKA